MAKKKPTPAKTAPQGNLRLEYRSPAELTENPRNWRRHPEAQLDALTDVISEVGWAGACLLNERTGRLIDGHARRTVALKQGAELVPVLIGDWSEEDEAKILATLDPLAAMATADAAALEALLGSVSTQSEALNDMLGLLNESVGAFDVAEIEPPELADGDKQPFQQMTFTLHDDQAEVIKQAIDAAKKLGDFVDSPNANSNGNALARIAEVFLGKC